MESGPRQEDEIGDDEGPISQFKTIPIQPTKSEGPHFMDLLYKDATGEIIIKTIRLSK